MLTEAHYKAVLKFFYFMLMDEQLTLTAAVDAIKLVQKKISADRSRNLDVVLVQAMHEVLQIIRSKKKTFLLSQPPKTDFKIASHEALTHWKEFRREIADDKCAEILVLRYINDCKPALIAEALGIPEGTVYYRIGGGLRDLAEKK